MVCSFWVFILLLYVLLWILKWVRLYVIFVYRYNDKLGWKGVSKYIFLIMLFIWIYVYYIVSLLG